MRVRLTDGTHEIEIDARGTRLPDLEATAGRLLDRLRGMSSSDQDDEQQPRFGFGRDLDGISLDSSTERADQYDDDRTDYDDEEDEGAHR